jgi:hypothetical protein
MVEQSCSLFGNWEVKEKKEEGQRASIPAGTSGVEGFGTGLYLSSKLLGRFVAGVC